MAVLALSGTTSSGTPPIASKAHTWASIQSGSACVHVALAKVKLEAPSTATKICAMRISPVRRSMTAGVERRLQRRVGHALRQRPGEARGLSALQRLPHGRARQAEPAGDLMRRY